LRRSHLALACVLAALLVAAPAQASPGTRVVERVNSIREAHGLSPLRQAPGLWRSTRWMARHLIRTDVFGHLTRVPVPRGFRSAGETLAYHTGWRPQVRRTVSRWMSSPGHRAVLLSSRYRWIGVGRARGRLGSIPATVWVAHVASR
jgi:uncharacterized protein YkwD